MPATGEWTAGRLLDMLAGVEGPVIANVLTGELWDPGIGVEQVEHLKTGVDEGAENRWRVGHFLAIAEVIRGPVGTLLVLADSYPSRATPPASRRARRRLAARPWAARRHRGPGRGPRPKERDVAFPPGLGGGGARRASAEDSWRANASRVDGRPTEAGLGGSDRGRW